MKNDINVFVQRTGGNVWSVFANGEKVVENQPWDVCDSIRAALWGSKWPCDEHKELAVIIRRNLGIVDRTTEEKLMERISDFVAATQGFIVVSESTYNSTDVERARKTLIADMTEAVKLLLLANEALSAKRS